VNTLAHYGMKEPGQVFETEPGAPVRRAAPAAKGAARIAQVEEFIRAAGGG
jgi:hypothetical protein